MYFRDIDLKHSFQVMDKLFEIPEDYWINFISDTDENMYRDMNTPQTPEPSRGCMCKKLNHCAFKSEYSVVPVCIFVLKISPGTSHHSNLASYNFLTLFMLPE